MQKRISILTATKTEYGLLKPLIKKVNNNLSSNVKRVIVKAFLFQNLIYTYKKMGEDLFSIDKK